MARLEFEMVGPVRIWLGLLGTIHYFRGSLDRRPVLDHMWSIVEQEVYVDARVLFRRARLQTINRWRDHAWTDTQGTEDASDGKNADPVDGAR